ncbi:MAG TPA: DUF1056 family protein [Mycobacterium sp.]|jgi:membrane protein DedA with SNARE-associated domain|uniref:DUF1056 family protein n=1 Tax=Mycobacterium sp. TaxID=1785 RepID=UPI002F3FCBD9
MSLSDVLFVAGLILLVTAAFVIATALGLILLAFVLIVFGLALGDADKRSAGREDEM